MEPKEKAKLLDVTSSRPADFLSDYREYDGRVAKLEYKREHQGTGRVNQKSCY